jgi:hypothetical protein
VASFITDPANFGVVLASLLVAVNGLGAVATKVAEEYQQDMSFGCFGVGTISTDLGVSAEDAAALMAMAKGRLDALAKTRIVAALQDMARQECWKCLEAVQTATEVLTAGQLKEFSVTLKKGILSA